ncbi:MAG: hypothetical protein GC168_09365 [Candidatus Hydrogenedens sp.]|nr:hypothetical protein [Candidatus Hydrogenedens sp.]
MLAVETTHHALSLLFSSSARVAVLRVLMLDPARPYYQRQLEQATGLPIRAIQRELERLTEAELLYRRPEGNRVYYQVDRDHPLFPELRSMVLKTSGPVDAMRGQLAVDPAVRAAFLSADEEQCLVVEQTGESTRVSPPPNIALSRQSADSFLRGLREQDLEVDAFLKSGKDLLGRRDDVLWRHIESAGYVVAKGAGVP